MKVSGFSELNNGDALNRLMDNLLYLYPNYLNL